MNEVIFTHSLNSVLKLIFGLSPLKLCDLDLSGHVIYQVDVNCYASVLLPTTLAF